MTEPAAIDELFRTFKATAWRLEVRTSYGLLAEDQPFQDFLTGKTSDTSWFTPWLDLMREQIKQQGKRVERVRVIDQPPSEYLRWEYHLNQFNHEAGEGIRYLPRALADDLHLPAYDFWIFDSAAVAFMQFDEQGVFVSPVVVEDQAVTRQHLAYRETAWELATPYEHYSL